MSQERVGGASPSANTPTGAAEPGAPPADPTCAAANPAAAHPAASAHGHAKESFSKLTLGSIGVVYGDIGTSPLYALQTVFSIDDGAVRPTVDDVYGVVSMMFWSVTLIVSVKYIGILMKADNEGEGGVMALTALARRLYAGRTASTSTAHCAITAAPARTSTNWPSTTATAARSGRNTLPDWRIDWPTTTRCSPSTSARRWCGRRAI